MKLSHFIAKQFEDELERLFQKEKTEPDFMHQDNYESCKERAMDWLETAFYGMVEQASNDVGYSIAVHREKEHGDDTMEEQAALLAAGADAEVSTRAWWSD